MLIHEDIEQNSLTRWALRLLAYPLFFASGAAGLIYEVVWTRLLLDTFGAGLYAVCAVLAAYMAGLALGSWALGRWSDRLRRPLGLYSGLELGIGLCGLAIPWVLHQIIHVDGWAYRTWGLDAYGPLTVLRFVTSFLIMVAPTTLMGATLPVLSRFMVRGQSHLGLHVGSLYAINTFGAVAGTFAAGFVLIANFGLRATGWTAVGLNLAVALCAFVLSLALEKREKQPQAAEPEAARRRAAPGRPGAAGAAAGGILKAPGANPARLILFTAFVSGAVALAAQVLWTRSLVFNFEYLKNTTYAFSAMLTVFLAGLALGSSLVGLIIDRQREPQRLYGILLVLMGMAMLFSVIMLYYGADLLIIADPQDPETNQFNWLIGVLNVMLQSVGVLGIPTLLMGMAFPVAARVFVRAEHVGAEVGRLYAVNTLGAILGSVLAGFVIVPLLGLTKGLIALGLIDAALGLLVLSRTESARLHLYVFTPLTLVMALVVWRGLPEDRGLQAMTTELDTQVFYKEGPLATVSVIENNIAERTIYVDGVGVAGTDPIIQTDQKSLAHVPMMLLPNAQSVLTVGFGSGGASYSLLLHDSLKTVHCAEICRTVPEAAPHLKAANHGFLENKDPRYRILFDDARSYLTHTEQRYDFIATDCTDLRYKSNANLYDLEYFTACRRRLTPDGIVVVWMPLGGMSPEVFKVALRTFYRVFPEMGIFYMANEPTHYVLLIGWQDRVRLDYGLFARRLADAEVREDLAELYLDDPVKLLSCFVTGGREQLKDFLAGDELNTQNNPLLEFESPKYGYGDRPVLDNLKLLMEHYVSPRRFMDESTIPPAELERLKRYEEALPWIVEGHSENRELRLENATMAYLKALRLAPEDLGLSRNLLQFPILQRRVQLERANPVPPMLLGRIMMLQPERLDQALSLLQEAERRLLMVQNTGKGNERLDADLAEIRKELREVESRLRRERGGQEQ